MRRYSIEGTIVGLQISIRKSGDVTILDLRGNATVGGDCEMLSSQIHKLMAKGVCKLLVNLADLIQIDSSGVSTIVEAYASLRRQGGRLGLLSPSGRVLVVLKVTHLLETIPNFEDESEALTSFQPRGYSATRGGRT